MSDSDQAATREQASSEHVASSGRIAPSERLASAFPGARPSVRVRKNKLRLPAKLKADCSRCAGLWCVAPPFYAVQGFGFDKPAHMPCRHLSRNGRCAIHAELASHGFPGCAAFDCYGAGQRVTQETFPGTSWRESDEAAARIFSAYTRLLALHRLMAMLALAEAALPARLASRMRSRRAHLDELGRSIGRSDESVDLGRLERETLSLLRETCRCASAQSSTGPTSPPAGGLSAKRRGALSWHRGRDRRAAVSDEEVGRS
jgi:hypothetical protein